MKKIAIISLSRSDYASVKPVAIAAQNDSDIEMIFIAGGSHLLNRFGNTINSIRNDGIKINHIVSFLKESDDTAQDLAQANIRALQEFTDIFIKTKPDSVFILGDRWEMTPAAIAASMLRIPIYHHSGGDVTQGSADNQTRYLLTTLSHFHLVALEQHKQRLIKIGEEDWRITVTGEPALTGLQNVEEAFEEHSSFILATFHPTSYDSFTFKEQTQFFLSALDLISETIILTAPNPDMGSADVYSLLQEYVRAKQNVNFYQSLENKYYPAMKKAKFMIGNSSSGIWEAPSFGLPVINIGKRQEDRVRGKNVIDVNYDLDEVKKAINVVTDHAFIQNIQKDKNPYVKDNTVELIIEKLKAPICEKQVLAKRLIDPLAEK